MNIPSNPSPDERSYWYRKVAMTPHDETMRDSLFSHLGRALSSEIADTVELSGEAIPADLRGYAQDGACLERVAFLAVTPAPEDVIEDGQRHGVDIALTARTHQLNARMARERTEQHLFSSESKSMQFPDYLRLQVVDRRPVFFEKTTEAQATGAPSYHDLKIAFSGTDNQGCLLDTNFHYRIGNSSLKGGNDAGVAGRVHNFAPGDRVNDLEIDGLWFWRNCYSTTLDLLNRAQADQEAHQRLAGVCEDSKSLSLMTHDHGVVAGSMQHINAIVQNPNVKEIIGARIAKANQTDYL